ncbi:hypothetical protein [Robinsoniella peoriensis]|uniref:hypothetical protein n=1 Tax=Robinsoniella peoriensis TaxID=180332 RepID=UPI00362D98B7
MYLIKNHKFMLRLKCLMVIILLVSLFPNTVDAAPADPKSTEMDYKANTRVTLSYPATRVVYLPLNSPIPSTKWWTEFSGNVLMQGTLRIHSWSYTDSNCKAIYTGWLYGAAS